MYSLPPTTAQRGSLGRILCSAYDVALQNGRSGQYPCVKGTSGQGSGLVKPGQRTAKRPTRRPAFCDDVNLMKFAVQLLAREIAEDSGTPRMQIQTPARAQASVLVRAEVPIRESREAAAAELAERLTEPIERELEQIANAPDVAASVTCPEGRVDLPIDLWSCKRTGERCPIQAQVWIQDEERFRAGCSAPEAVQDGVLRAIEVGYRGAHHIPGRYRCPLCPGKAGSAHRYRFPFELYMLGDVLDLGAGELRTALRKRIVQENGDLRILSSAVCASCLVGAIGDFGLARVDEFEILDVVATI